MHIEAVHLDAEKIANDEGLSLSPGLRTAMWAFVIVGSLAFMLGLAVYPLDLFWAAYFSTVIFWMGIGFGGFMIAVIFQIVKAQWAIPVRRIAEANIVFLPFAVGLMLVTYFGKEYLFDWGREPMPGREWWMQPNFVYVRFILLFSLLIGLMWRFTRLSVGGDLAVMRRLSKNGARWLNCGCDSKCCPSMSEEEKSTYLQEKLSYSAPVIVAAYALIYSLFSFEMVMGMDFEWFSNMFGGFMFIGNIYGGWAMVSILCIYFAMRSQSFGQIFGRQQLHDLGKLTFGFGILWAYLFFSQFLPIWYGNLPEETQWLILRTREYPWKSLGWMVLSMGFVIPFIMLLSRDIKKTPPAFAAVCTIILVGLALERYVIVMPEISPRGIPLGFMEIFFHAGCLGTYALCIDAFLRKVPYAPITFYRVFGGGDAH